MKHPLESFFLNYLALEDIPFEEVDLKVYDVLLSDKLSKILSHNNNNIVRFCFDPEAISEYPDSQLLTIGDPSLDIFFQQAISSGKTCRVFLSDTNCFSKNMEKTIKQTLLFPQNSTISFAPSRLFYFPKALFYFQITYLSDEKLQMPLSVGVDLHFGRIARNLENLLDSSKTVPFRPLPYPDASSISIKEGYEIAGNECSGKATAGATMLKQKLQTGFIKESQRLKNYFNELRKEMHDRKEKAKNKGENLSGFFQKLQAIDLEEKARFADLQKKNLLQTEIRLVNVLWIEQLQILTPLTVLHQKNTISIEVVWDPKANRIEPLACPKCQSPTLELTASKQGKIGCPLCQAK